MLGSGWFSEQCCVNTAIRAVRVDLAPKAAPLQQNRASSSKSPGGEMKSQQSCASFEGDLDFLFLQACTRHLLSLCSYCSFLNCTFT